MRRRSSFKKTDLTRAAKAVQAAGLEVARVEVTPDGLIRVVPGKPGDVGNATEVNEWDETLSGEPSAQVR